MIHYSLYSQYLVKSQLRIYILSMKTPNQQSVANNEILFYQSVDGAPKISVRLENETVWLTQAQLVVLFESSKANVSEHIKHIFEEKELDGNAVVRNFRTTATDGKTYNIEHYNLDMIISLGYRIKSTVATQFRIWATARLREYLIKGFTMDDDRLKGAGGGSYWKELLERIRDIRSSEKVLYRQVLDLYATSIDYNPKTDESKKFFSIVQNKLHYAANGKTAAELIVERVDADKPFMGLLTFSKDGVRKSDVTIAKNYLSELEIKKLNNVVSAYFDIAELRALDQKQTTMHDYIKQLDKLISSMDREVLQSSGKVSHIEAEAKAHAEYIKYQAQTLSPVESAYVESIKVLEKKVEKKIRNGGKDTNSTKDSS